MCSPKGLVIVTLASVSWMDATPRVFCHCATASQRCTVKVTVFGIDEWVQVPCHRNVTFQCWTDHGWRFLNRCEVSSEFSSVMCASFLLRKVPCLQHAFFINVLLAYCCLLHGLLNDASASLRYVLCLQRAINNCFQLLVLGCDRSFGQQRIINRCFHF